MPNFSAPQRGSERDEYISSRLSAGRSVDATVTINKDNFWDPGFRENGWIFNWEFQLPARDTDHSALKLQIGDNVFPLGSVVDDADRFFGETDLPAGNSTPYFGPAFETRIGTAWAHPLSMLWWAQSDKILLGYAFNRSEPSNATFCIIMPKPHMVQVWASDGAHKYLREKMKAALIPKDSGVQADSRNEDKVYLTRDAYIFERDYGKASLYNRDLAYLNNATHESARAKRDEIYRKTYAAMTSERFGYPFAEFNSTSLFGKTDLASTAFNGKISARIPDVVLASKSYPVRRVLATPAGWIYLFFHGLIIDLPVGANTLYRNHGLIFWLLIVLIIVPCAVLYLVIYIPWVSDGRPDFMEWGPKNRLVQFGWRCCSFFTNGRRKEKVQRYWASLKRWWASRNHVYLELNGEESVDQYRDEEEEDTGAGLDEADDEFGSYSVAVAEPTNGGNELADGDVQPAGNRPLRIL